MGVDWGKQNDYTVLVVLDTVAGAMVAFDRMNRIDTPSRRSGCGCWPSDGT